MIKYILIVVAICAIPILSSFQDEAMSVKGCDIMHEGTFIYGDADDLVKVVIKGQKHTEYHAEGKYIIKSEIEWVNDCEYNMTLKNVTIPEFPYGKGDIMNVKIREVKGDKIFYEATVKGQSWPGVFKKIN